MKGSDLQYVFRAPDDLKRWGLTEKAARGLAVKWAARALPFFARRSRMIAPKMATVIATRCPPLRSFGNSSANTAGIVVGGAQPFRAAAWKAAEGAASTCLPDGYRALICASDRCAHAWAEEALYRKAVELGHHDPDRMLFGIVPDTEIGRTYWQGFTGELRLQVEEVSELTGVFTEELVGAGRRNRS